jgi:hypothetical protein
MALGTYSELQAAVASWLARPGDPTLVPFIPDFVRLAEARLNRDLRLRGMQHRATAEAESAFLALPDDFLEMRNLQLDTDPATRLELMSPEQMDTLGAGSRRGRPRWYSVVGSEIQLAPAPDGPYTVEMIYWSRVPPLTLAEPVNWLLAEAPDVYLYAALIEAMAFIGNDERLPLWGAAYDRAALTLQSTHDRSTWSGSTPQVRADTGRT